MVALAIRNLVEADTLSKWASRNDSGYSLNLALCDKIDVLCDRLEENTLLGSLKGFRAGFWDGGR